MAMVKDIKAKVYGRLKPYFKKARILRSYAGIRRSFDINHFINIFIDPAFNTCNLNCIYCPAGLKLNIKETPPEMMTLDTLKVICSKSLREFRGKICLYNWGESFLNPEIDGMVRFIKENTKARIMLNSNLSFINDDLIKRILKPLKGDIVLISCDGFSQATCEEYRKGTDFDKVLHNIELIRDYKNPETQFAWQYLEFPWNHDDIKPAEEYSRKNDIIFYTQVGGITPDYPMLPTPNTLNKKKLRCGFFLEGLTINPDGEVYPCCSYFGPKRFSIGNAAENTLEEIFMQGKGKDMIDYLTYKSEGNDDLFCKRCIERNTGDIENWLEP